LTYSRRSNSSDPVRILIFHGYLLRGTGSNIYNANLARALAELGHEVHLFCQDRTALPPKGVTIHVPDIGRLLPVYDPRHRQTSRSPII
jgi:Glycosyltransferase Family 4